MQLVCAAFVVITGLDRKRMGIMMSNLQLEVTEKWEWLGFIKGSWEDVEGGTIIKD